VVMVEQAALAAMIMVVIVGGMIVIAVGMRHGGLVQESRRITYARWLESASG